MEIRTNRCKILKLKESDYQDIKGLYLNEDVRRFLGGISSRESFHNNFADMNSCEDGSFYWVVRLKDNDAFIGLVSLDKYHDGLNTELSYQFKPRWWGQGYGEEVIRKIIDYAFDELKLEKLVSETQSANKSSCKLLKKVGMTLEQTIIRFGAEQCVFSILK